MKPAHNGTAMEQNFILLLESSDSHLYVTYGSLGLQIIQTAKLFH
jgi:predicted HAD superfamily Cof-like phosphohydrolase